MKKIIIFLMISASITACYDDINDVTPSDAFEFDEFFSAPSDFDAALGGAFQQLQNYYALELLVMGDIPSDNVIQVQTGRTSNDVYWDWNYTSQNDIGMLDEGYEAVNIANSIVENIDALPDGDIKDNILGQAIAIRALAHFDMARVYGQIPTQSAGASSSLGVAYLRFEDGDTGDTFAKPSRETIESNYNEIEADLLQARGLIDASSTEFVNSFTVESINALLSRVYLYLGEYQNAIDAADLVTTGVAARANLADVFRDASDDGIIFKLGINQSLDNVQPGVVWSQSSGSDVISEYAIAYDLFTSLAADDIRASAYVYTGSNQGNDYNAIRKWLGETGQVNGRTDMPAIRAAEVILNKAEAQFELGREVEALATLNELRDERYSSYTGGETGAALEDAIRFERRIEFFAEYHRWFDIKRYGLAVTRSTFGDIADGSGTVAQNRVLEVGAREFQLPIPIEERQVNPNFQQNPGYGD